VTAEPGAQSAPREVKGLAWVFRQGVRELYSRKIFEIADAHRRILQHIGKKSASFLNFNRASLWMQIAEYSTVLEKPLNFCPDSKA
jgi:hypothetical protein